MSGAFYCRSELSAPWGVAVPAMAGYLLFHFVAAGRCWLEVPGAEARELRAGDLVLVPHGDGHRILSEAGAHAEPLFDIPRESANERYEVIRHGGGGAPVTLICGAVRFGHPTATHMVRLLPSLICIDPGSSPHDDWLQSTLRFMAAEARALQPGGEAVMTRLADIVVIQAIRSWIAHDPAAQTGWLAGLQDRQIGRAIAAIHRDPAQGWTLDSLAGEVRDVALGLCRALHRAGGHAADAVPEPLAHAHRAHLARRARRAARKPGRARGLPVGGGVQPRVQAPGRHAAGRGGAAPADAADAVARRGLRSS